MSGPQIICFGCGELTTMQKPVCDNCLRASGQVPVNFCSLCEAGLLRDPHGQHVTTAGGYAGKCTA